MDTFSLDPSAELTRIQGTIPGQSKKEEGFTLGKLFKAVVGAGIGLGASRVAGNLLDVKDTQQPYLDAVSAGLGALVNSGILKQSEARDAFRLGFVKAALAAGYFEKDAGMWPVPILDVSPSGLLAIPRGLAGAVTTAGSALGSTASTLGETDTADAEVAEINAQNTLLQEELSKLKAQKRVQTLKKLLAKRRARR